MNRECRSLRLRAGQLEVLDQTLLPREERWRHADSPETTAALIHRLAIRGAPLIGVSAALSLGLFARSVSAQSDRENSAAAIQEKADILLRSRPTAVNLRNCLESCLEVFRRTADPSALLDEALRLFDEDVALCERMAERGAVLIGDGDGVLTHCNTGGLATVGRGTALGVIAKAWEQGKRIHVYVDETRPLLQGSRLTAWELKKLGIPFTVICDSMAATLMRQGKIQKVFTGADRVAVNGDSANKIGTYAVAVLAHHHRLPFYIVAPRSTYDPRCPDGASIPIEIRDSAEITAAAGDPGLPAWNPSFDVTPASLITAIVFDDELRRIQSNEK